jgi:hypothetical protein
VILLPLLSFSAEMTGSPSASLRSGTARHVAVDERELDRRADRQADVAAQDQRRVALVAVAGVAAEPEVRARGAAAAEEGRGGAAGVRRDLRVPRGA